MARLDLKGLKGRRAHQAMTGLKGHREMMAHPALRASPVPRDRWGLRAPKVCREIPVALRVRRGHLEMTARPALQARLGK